jgi:hypothetical protein
MGCLGVHFALDENDVNALKSQLSDAARLEYLQEEIEGPFFGEHPEWLAENDKAWDAIHRTLTDGQIGWDNGAFPLSHVILGGELLYELDDYIMTLKTPWEVQEIAKALPQLSEDEFRKKYFRIDPDDYGFRVNQENYEYAWFWFQGVRDLYDRAARANRSVLFTASQ